VLLKDYLFFLNLNFYQELQDFQSHWYLRLTVVWEISILVSVHFLSFVLLLRFSLLYLYGIFIHKHLSFAVELLDELAIFWIFRFRFWVAFPLNQSAFICSLHRSMEHSYSWEFYQLKEQYLFALWVHLYQLLAHLIQLTCQQHLGLISLHSDFHSHCWPIGWKWLWRFQSCLSVLKVCILRNQL